MASLKSNVFTSPLSLFICIHFAVDFTNITRAAFTHADHKSAKNTVKPSVVFALLGSTCIKAAHRMLMKLTPGPRG